MKLTLNVLCCLLLSAPVYGQQNDGTLQELFAELKQKDSLVFNLGFNECDTAQLRVLISDDFEFYHDQSGLLDSKENFIRNIPNLCNMNYKPTRVLVDGSMEVFPLYSKGELYGALMR